MTQPANYAKKTAEINRASEDAKEDKSFANRDLASDQLSRIEGRTRKDKGKAKLLLNQPLNSNIVGHRSGLPKIPTVGGLLDSIIDQTDKVRIRNSPSEKSVHFQDPVSVSADIRPKSPNSFDFQFLGARPKTTPTQALASTAIKPVLKTASTPHVQEQILQAFKASTPNPATGVFAQTTGRTTSESTRVATSSLVDLTCDRGSAPTRNESDKHHFGLDPTSPLAAQYRRVLSSIDIAFQVADPELFPSEQFEIKSPNPISPDDEYLDVFEHQQPNISDTEHDISKGYYASNDNKNNTSLSDSVS